MALQSRLLQQELKLHSRCEHGSSSQPSKRHHHGAVGVYVGNVGDHGRAGHEHSLRIVGKNRNALGQRRGRQGCLHTLRDAWRRSCSQIAARQICQRHTVAGEPLQIRNIDVQFGHASSNASGRYSFAANAQPTNSTRVHTSFVRRVGSVAALPALGQFLGKEEFVLEEFSIATRVDNDICLVVDRSGSMAWDLSNDAYSYPGELHGRSIIQNYFLPPHATLSRWAALRTSINTFLNVLNNNPYHPRVSLVSYASNFEFGTFTSTVSSIDQPLTHDFSLITAQIQALGSRPLIGNTNIAAGLRDGINTLASQTTSRPHATHNIVLLTDGMLTQGDDPVALAALALSQNIKVHTITFSAQADQALMIQVAAAGAVHTITPPMQRP
jgi:Ca-activated chloride channel homolog